MISYDKLNIMPTKGQVFFNIILLYIFMCWFLCIFYINNTAKGKTSLMFNKLLLIHTSACHWLLSNLSTFTVYGYRPREGFCAGVTIINSFTDKMFDECEMECRALPECVGYNFKAWGPEQGYCELLSTMCETPEEDENIYVFDKSCTCSIWKCI